MAGGTYARNLYFGVRVEDRATRPLRRIAADFRALGKQGLAQRVAVANQAAAAERATRARVKSASAALAEVQSQRTITAQTIRKQAAIDKETRARLASAGVSQRIGQLDEKRIASASALAQVQGKISARSGALATQYDKETAAKLRSAGVSKQIGQLDQKRITIANQLGQTEMALAQRRTKAGRAYEGMLGKVGGEGQAGITPPAFARVKRGILMPNLTQAQLVAQQEKLIMSQASLAEQESILAGRAGLAAGALEKQREATAALAREDTILTALTAQEQRLLMEQSRLANEEGILAEKAGLATGALEAQRKATAALGDQDLVLAEKESVLQERFAAASMAHSTSIRNMNKAGAAVDRFPVDRLRGIAGYARHAGAALAVMGAVSVAALGFAAKGAADFATQVTIAATQSTTAGRNSVKNVQQNAAVIQAAILKMMSKGKVLATPQEQTGAVYRIFSGTTLPGGQRAQLKEGIGLLKEFNQVATANAGLVKLDEVVSAGLVILNRFRVPLKELPHDLNIMQAAVRFGNLNLSQFISAMNQAAPAAQSAGYSVTDMSAAIAFLSREFTSTNQAATGYARLLQILARPDVVQALKQHGVAVTQVKDGVQKLLPIQTIAKNIVDRFGGSVKNGSLFLQNFFKSIGATTQGTIQARKVLISYVQNQQQASLIFKQVSRDHNELLKSLKSAQASPGVRWQEFLNQMKALTLEIGAGVIPAIAGLADQVKGLAGWFNNLSPHAKRMIGYVGALIGVATLLSGVILTLAGGFLSAAIAIGVFNGMITSAEVGTGILAGEMGIAAPELLLVLAALAALGFAMYKYPDQAKQVGNAIKSIVSDIAPFIGDLFKLAGALTMALIAIIKLGARLAGLMGQLRIATSRPWQIAIDILFKIPGAGKIGNILKSGPMKTLGKYLKDYSKFQQYVPSPFTPVDIALAHMNLGGKDKAAAPSVAPMSDVLLSNKALRDHVKVSKEVTKAAKILGVDATPSFKKLFMNLVEAKRHYNELKAAGASSYKLYLAQLKVQNAAAALDTNTNKQKVAAAKAAATAAADLGNKQKKFSDAHILVEAKNAKRLGVIANQSGTLKAWKAYYAAQAKLSKDATDVQAQAAQSFLDQTATMSNAAVLIEARKVKRLETLAKQTGTLSAWRAYYAAQKKLSEDASDTQLQAVQSFLDQTGAMSDAAVLAAARHIKQLGKIAQNKDTLAAWKKYYDALDALQSGASSSQMQAVQQVVDFTVDSASKAKDKLKSILSNIRSIYDTFLQQNESAFGTIFSGPYMQSAVTQNRLDWGQVLNMKDLTKDLKSQVIQFRQWRSTIAKLRARGLPKGLVDQILALGPEAGMQQAKLLAKATPAQLAQYKKLWLAGQKDVHNATMRDLKNQLNEWRKHGRRIALAIAQGLRDENVALEAALKKMIERAFPGLDDGKPGKHTASTPAAGHRPRNSGHNQTPTHTKEVHHHKKEEVHYHVTGVDAERSMETQLKHAYFQHRTRLHHKN